MAEWTHDDLMRDLAAHIATPSRMVWCDMQLGPVGSPRPDVFAIDKSFAHPRAITYECKISRADFRADATAGKWQAYLKFSAGVYFAAPAGLLQRDDVPKGCGLIVRGDDGWRTLRAPTLQPFKLGQDVCLKLLIDGRKAEFAGNGARRERTPWGAMERIAKKWGHDAAEIISDLDHARRSLESAREAEAEARARAEAVRKESDEHVAEQHRRWLGDICNALCLPQGSRVPEIQQRLNELRMLVQKNACFRHDNLRAAEQAIDDELRRVRRLRETITGESA